MAISDNTFLFNWTFSSDNPQMNWPYFICNTKRQVSLLGGWCLLSNDFYTLIWIIDTPQTSVLSCVECVDTRNACIYTNLLHRVLAMAKFCYRLFLILLPALYDRLICGWLRLSYNWHPDTQRRLCNLLKIGAYLPGKQPEARLMDDDNHHTMSVNRKPKL